MKTYWLASYPKSGNTWLRVFLSNLLYPEHAPANPNNLPLRNLIASARTPFHEIIGVPSSLLTREEYSELRPEIDKIIGRDWKDPICVRKAHDAYTYLPDARPMMGKRPDFAAIYVVRNPFDVAISLAHHWGQSVELTVSMMCNDKTAMDHRSDRISSQFFQRLLSWSGHVKSWLSAPLDLCAIRYEDLHRRPIKTFRKAVEFLELNATDAEIAKAVDASSFTRLKQFEQEHGFLEAPNEEPFFRKGRIDDGYHRLDEKSRRQLVHQNEIVEQILQHAAGSD